MKAVILAAGMGKRLRPLTEKTPKAFMNIGDKALIEYSLDNIKKTGIEEIFIVTGFMESFIKKKLGSSYDGVDIHYISNPDYEQTGSMYSLSQTAGKINDDIILLESDLLYEPRALTEIMKTQEPDAILVAPVSGSGDEVFIRVDEDSYLKDLGKNITQKENVFGELTGITKLSHRFLEKLYIEADGDYRRKEMNYHYEEVLFKLSKKYPIRCILINDLAWIEIDKPYDLKKAREVIFPKIEKAQNEKS